MTALFILSHINGVIDLFDFFPSRCVPEAAAGRRDECDLLVPGEQRGHSPPTAPGDDLCRTG